MNSINILLLVSFIANIFVLIALITMLIIKERNNDKALDASHKVLYSKMMTITDKLNALLKNLDIEEEDYRLNIACITEKDKTMLADTCNSSPAYKEAVRFEMFVDRKTFYNEILLPMRAEYKITVEFIGKNKTGEEK